MCTCIQAFKPSSNKYFTVLMLARITVAAVINLFIKPRKATWGFVISGRSIEHGHVLETVHPEGTTATWQVYGVIICMLRGYFERHLRDNIINIKTPPNEKKQETHMLCEHAGKYWGTTQKCSPITKKRQQFLNVTFEWIKFLEKEGICIS